MAHVRPIKMPQSRQSCQYGVRGIGDRIDGYKIERDRRCKRTIATQTEFLSFVTDTVLHIHYTDGQKKRKRKEISDRCSDSLFRFLFFYMIFLFLARCEERLSLNSSGCYGIAIKKKSEWGNRLVAYRINKTECSINPLVRETSRNGGAWPRPLLGI